MSKNSNNNLENFFRSAGSVKPKISKKKPTDSKQNERILFLQRNSKSLLMVKMQKKVIDLVGDL